MKDRTTEYAKLIVSNKKICGRSEYLACKRHFDNIADKDFEFTFDVKEAEKHINIANELIIGEGIEAKPLKTRGFQNFIIGSLFGWRKKHSKIRRFREAYVQIARQNGKSFIAGEMSNDFATFSGYQYGRIFLTATKQDQANIVWDEVKKFIENDSDLGDLYKIRTHERTITSKVTGTVIKAIGRDTKSADGFRSVLSVADELHAHPNNQMYKLMQDGQIGVDSALMLAITTAGFNLNSFCYEHYKFCKRILSGAIKKESLFIYIAELDDDDDIWKPENWAKANPLQLWNEDNTLNQTMMARMAEKALEAKEKQGQELTNFLTKSLNRWVTAGENAYLDAEKWAACACDITIDQMCGQECYLGIDLSSGGDLTSLSFVFPNNEVPYIWSVSFMPEKRLLEHEVTDNAPYRDWVNRGLMILTSGLYGIKTDYGRIMYTLNQIIKSYDLKVIGCGYDDHNAAGILKDLESMLDCDLTVIVQSARSLNDATVDFQLAVKGGLVCYDKNNSLLSWSAVSVKFVR